MKTIYLLRHAKSSWKDAELSDIDRPLNKRGKENAPFIGKRLKKRKVQPDLIISSPAKRTFRTAVLVAAELGYEEKNIRIEMSLYGANTEEIHRFIQNLDDPLNKVMLVGHNPAFTQAVEHFSGTSIGNLPTSGVVRLDFDVKKWQNVKANKGKLVFFESPKSQKVAEPK